MATKNNTWIPTPRMRKAAELLANPEWSGTITELCEKVGVDRTAYYKWIKKPEFNTMVAEHIEEYTTTEYARAWKALMAKVDKGDVGALRLFFELQKKVGAQGSVTVNIVDDVK